VASFFTLAYALSWLAWLLPALGVGGTLGLVALVAGTFGPAVAAVILTWSMGASVRAWARSIIRWRVHPRWYLVAFGLPIVTVGLESSIVTLLGQQIEPALIPGRLASYIPTLALTALLQGGNEEPGWRGFALPRLQERYTPVAATLVLGLVWAFWHLPVLAANPNTQHGLSAAVMTAVNIVALTVVYTWLYNHTRSVLLCILLHASGNTANALLIPLPDAALQGDVYQTFILVTMIVNLLVAVILVAATRGRLGYGAAERVPATPTAPKAAATAG
jgi:membrane protease YdiL (CAAX protease family)